MAAAPRFKVYRRGEYVAACRYAEDAALLVQTEDAEVRHGHRHVVWHAGRDGVACDTVDDAAHVMRARVEQAAGQ